MTDRTTFGPALYLSSPVAGGALRRDVDRLFDEVFGLITPSGAARAAASPAGRTTPGAITPASTLREDADGWTVIADLPGVRPADVEVTAEDRVLTIRATRRLPEPPTGTRTLADTRGGATFLHRLRLPRTADAGAVTAELADGVLTLRIAKLAPARPRRIDVRPAGNGVDGAAGASAPTNDSGDGA